MHKPIASLLAAVVALPLLLPPAAASEGEVVDMTHYLCKDLMRMHSEERSVTLGVLHGYMLGRKGATSFDSGAASKLSADFIEYCLDHPADKALASFEKLYK